MCKVLNREEVMKLRDGERVDGLVLIQSMSVLPQKNGGKYISGNIQIKGQVPFKVWSNTYEDSAFMVLSNILDSKNKMRSISGYANYYGGTFSLIIDEVKSLEITGYSEMDFLEEVYDIKVWSNKLMSVLKKNCSDGAYNLFEELITPVFDRFSTEFAAVKYHDSCKTGLLAHTTKVTKMSTILAMYPNIVKRLSPDLIFLSCALHDIGKIYEYNNGTISDGGMRLSHHTYGVLFLAENKEKIVSVMGEDFYISLLSVVEQHHGEYEEKPRTLIAYVVHKLDELDSVFTVLDSMVKDSNGEQLQYLNFKLI